MKKTIGLIIAIIMLLSVLSLASCSNNGDNDGTTENGGTTEQPSDHSGSETNTPDTPTLPGNKSKTLVVYFSATGNTERFAGYIAKVTSGTLFELIPTVPYTADDLKWTVSGSRVNREHDDVSLRDIPLENTVPENWDSYDTIYIGYPIWWQIAAWPVNNFIKGNDFTGKTVIPFCTSTSSELGESDKLLADMAGEGNWLDGKRFRSSVSEEAVTEWVNSMTASQISRFPSELVPIPDGYMDKAEKQGKLENLYYDTYESFSYAEKKQKLTKRAVVYLPYGYDESQQYPVFYLMHGGWSDETIYMGTPENPRWMKNVLDHGIANGEIPPMIVVCPTYNNTSPEDSGDYSLALQLTNNYHNELENDLIPAVDSKYSTIADRDHRAFCGFSMGSMTTWRTFEHSLEYFRYFMPSSGGPARSTSDYANIIKDYGYDWDDFFIFAASGTADFAYSGFKRGIDSMIAEGDTFRLADNEKDGNIYYLESDGDHTGTYAMMYFYNGLRWIWD